MLNKNTLQNIIYQLVFCATVCNIIQANVASWLKDGTIFKLSEYHIRVLKLVDLSRVRQQVDFIAAVNLK